MICPKCGKNILKKEIVDKDEKKKKKGKTKEKDEIAQEQQKLSEIGPTSVSLASKLQGKVKVKEKLQEVKLESEKIELKKGEYIKLFFTVLFYCSKLLKN